MIFLYKNHRDLGIEITAFFCLLSICTQLVNVSPRQRTAALFIYCGQKALRLRLFIVDAPTVCYYRQHQTQAGERDPPLRPRWACPVLNELTQENILIQCRGLLVQVVQRAVVLQRAQSERSTRMMEVISVDVVLLLGAHVH